MKVSVVDHTDLQILKQWETWCLNHASAHFFQSPAFARLVTESGVYGFGLIVAEDNSGEWLGILAYILFHEPGRILRHLTTRSTVYGGPVLAERLNNQEKSETAAALLSFVTNHLRNQCLYIQFRNLSDTSGFKKAFKALGYSYSERLNLLKPIQNMQIAYSGLSRSRRRQLQLSRKNGLTVRPAQSIQEVDTFYALLKALYRDKVKKPLPSPELFRRFYLQSQDSSHPEPGKILIADYQGRIVGGIMAPLCPNGVIFEWYVCGLDKEYSHHNIFPSVALTWAAMEAGHAAGCHTFDFMGMGLPGKPYGVRDFKARFGGDWVNFGRWSIVNAPFRYQMTEIAYNLLRMIKKV